MRRLFAMLVAAALLGAFVPGTTAAESQTESYLVGGGFFVSGALGLSVMCPDFCWYEDDQIREDLDGDSENGYEIDQKSPVPVAETVPDFGGVQLVSSSAYDSVVVKPNDDLFGTVAGISACYYHPDGDNLCEPGQGIDGVEDFQSDWTCGVVTLVGAPFTGTEVTVWALSLVVLEDLTACGASSGTITGDFFMA